MSYDLNIGEVELNFTSNINTLLDTAVKGTKLRDLNGVTGRKAEMMLVRWVNGIMINPGRCKNACSTEWGTFNECLGVLMELISISQHHPEETWHLIW